MTTQNGQLRALAARFPLPSGWGSVAGHFDELVVGSLTLRLVGLHVRRPDGLLQTVSVAEDGPWPVERAYLRLVELAALATARAAGGLLPSRLLGGGEEPVPACTVFPRSDDPARWQYDDESGTALALADGEPVERLACLELIERDAVLRSWHGETRPEPVPCPTVHLALAPLYRFRMALFPQTALADANVVGLFGLPGTDRLPVLIGFAAATTVEGAFRLARRRLLESYAFAPLPCDEPPPFVPSRLYHRESFQHVGSVGGLLSWLDGRHCKLRPLRPAPRPYRFRIVDLTPPHLRGRLSVAKAVAPEARPLVFGRPPAALAPSALFVHPIA